MSARVVVWGTGNVGRPAMRAVAADPDLELVGVIVADPAKVGRDAGELRDLATAGRDGDRRRRRGARRRTRRGRLLRLGRLPARRRARRRRALPRAGRQRRVVGDLRLLHPPTAPAELRERVEAACAAGRTVDLRERHRSRLGPRPPAARAHRHGGAHRRDPLPGDLQLRALPPARRGAQAHRLRRAARLGAADAAARGAPRHLGRHGAHGGRRPGRRSSTT